MTTMFFMLFFVDLSYQTYVFHSYCISDGIGTWLERGMLPLILNHYCPKIIPIFKTCDFIGHAQRSYKNLFGITIDQKKVDYLMKNSSHKSISLDFKNLWKPQFKSLDCADLEKLEYVFFSSPPPYGSSKYEFNSDVYFSLPPGYKLNLKTGCFMRVVVHFRAGDVFSGFDHADIRSMGVPAMQKIVKKLHEMFFRHRIHAFFYIITELGIDNAIKLSEMLDGANVLFASQDEESHIALASEADILVLCFSDFSWMISLFNSATLKIVSANEEGQAKYLSSPNVFKESDDYNSVVDNLIRKKKSDALCLLQ